MTFAKDAWLAPNGDLVPVAPEGHEEEAERIVVALGRETIYPKDALCNRGWIILSSGMPGWVSYASRYMQNAPLITQPQMDTLWDMYLEVSQRNIVVNNAAYTATMLENLRAILNITREK